MNFKKLINPINFFGGNCNVSDDNKFNQAIKLLRECTSGNGNIPIFVSDNIITWNKNLSFLRDDYFKSILESEDVGFIEKSIIWRLYVLIYFAEACQKLDGDFLELGCKKGDTAKRVSEKIDFKSLNKYFWLYDLFEWKEGDEHQHLPEHDNPRMYENIKDRFADQPWVKIVKGNVPDSFKKNSPDQVAFAHIDMNNPSPEAGALEFVLPRLSRSGIVILDDYGWWGYSDQKLKLDPIAAKHSLRILELPTGQGLILKP